MLVIIVNQYKKKLIILSAVILVWIAAILLTGVLLKGNLVLNVTINDALSFSHPIDMQVDDIFVNHQLENLTAHTSSIFKRLPPTEFSSYQSLEGKFSFKYPSAFILDEKSFEGSEVLYHIDFRNKANTTHGFVEVWHLPYSLQEFLENSKATSLLNYKYFNEKAVTVNGLPGYYWDYSVLGNDQKFYKASEIFFKKGDRMYRISYFVPENLWNKDQSDIYWSIVDSFKTY